MTSKLIGLRIGMQAVLAVWLTVGASAEPDIPKGVLPKLSSDRYTEREKAYAELRKWAVKNVNDAPEILHRAWSASEEPEAKTRCFQLMKEMVIQRKYGRGKGFVGIRMEECEVPGKPGEPARPGIRVSLVLPDTPAAKSGLKVGDVVLGVDDLDFGKGAKKIEEPQIGGARMQGARIGRVIGMGTVIKFSDYIQSKQPDDVITLHLVRAGKLSDMKIKLMKRPASANIDPFGRSMQDDSKQQGEKFFKSWLKQKGE